jgi:dTMP kinase
MNGLFITLEGGEGSGKTTLAQKLYEEILRRDIAVARVREPGGTPLGEKIRQLLLDKSHDTPICEHAELLLLLTARVQHLEEKILPLIKNGYIVLCDRFHDSTIAYQGHGRGLGIDYVENLCATTCDDVWPDMTLYLDIDPEIGIARTRHLEKEYAKASETDRFESEALDFHRRVREGYHLLAEKHPQRVKTVDAALSQEEIYQQSLALIENIITMSNIS